MTLMDKDSSVGVDVTCFVITENEYLCYGLSILLCQTRFYHVPYDGKGNWSRERERTSVIVIVDGNIFTKGQWHGFKKLQGLYPHARRIWLMSNNYWGMWPYGCSRDRMLSSKCDLSVFTGKLFSILKGNDDDSDILHYPVLTEKEKTLAEYLLRGDSIYSLSVRITKSEKLIYNYRYSLQEKFGFRMAAWMVFIYRKNHEDFPCKWLLRFNENICLCKRCRHS